MALHLYTLTHAFYHILTFACACLHDQECNSEIISIKGWEALWACAAQVEDWHHLSSHNQDAHKTMVSLDLSNESLPCNETWKNTITVTRRGAVIIRLSFSKYVCDTECWDEQKAAGGSGSSSSSRSRVLNACNVICRVIENCC